MEKVYSFLFFVVFYFCFLWHFVFVFCGVPASKFYSKTVNDMTSTLWGIERIASRAKQDSYALKRSTLRRIFVDSLSARSKVKSQK